MPPSKPTKPVAPRETVASVKAQHLNDLTLIGETMLRVAKDNGFCPLFWTEVDALNASLATPIPINRKQWARVEVSMTLEGDFDVTHGDGYYANDDLTDENEEAIYDAIAKAVKGLGITLDEINVESVEG